MRFGISRHHSLVLAKSAAVLAMGAVLAGCSAANLTDGLTTSSTGGVVTTHSTQSYPGDKIVRPKEPVGVEVQSVGLSSPSPVQTTNWPTYNAPASGSSGVSSSPLPPPTGAVREPVAQAVKPPETKPAQVASLPRVPQATPAASNSASANTYTVVAGDTLYSISRKTGVSVEQLRQANGISGETIRVGQKLTLTGGSATIASAQTASPSKKPEPVKVAVPANADVRKPAETQPANVQNAQTASKDVPPTQVQPKAQQVEAEQTVASLPPQSTGVDRLRWPVRGRVIANFGSNSGGKVNDGIDIAVPEGTSVHAAENGVVIYAGDGLKGFGNTILVRHEDGLVTVYGHTSAMKVKRGDTVRRGQEIALSGMTGDADSPKLHFEVRKGTSPVNPMTYLE